MPTVRSKIYWRFARPDQRAAWGPCDQPGRSPGKGRMKTTRPLSDEPERARTSRKEPGNPVANQAVTNGASER